LSWDEGSRYPAAARELLPADSVTAAEVAVAVHLALTGTATALDVDLRRGGVCRGASPASPAGFTAVAEDRAVATALPAVGDRVRVALPHRSAAAVVRVYLPEGEQVFPLTVTSVGGTIEPAPPPSALWVAYGDSITHGWLASSPHHTWPVRAADRLGVGLVNLGLAGAARGELPAAVAIGESGADMVTIAWGTNAWSKLPTDRRQIAETTRLFLTTVRQGLPSAPIVVLSPLVRPGAESTANRFGDNLAALRVAMEDAVHAFVKAHGDGRLTLIPGLGLLGPDHLADGVHPGDRGHELVAAAVASALESAR